MQEPEQPRAFFRGAVTDSDKLFPAPGKECPEKRLLGWAEKGWNYRSLWGLGSVRWGLVTGRGREGRFADYAIPPTRTRTVQIRAAAT